MTAWVAFAAVAVACSLLSMVVVARRWAFVGEGIGHSGFGGAGTAWLLMALFPALDRFPWLPQAGVVLFALAAAFGMARLSRRGPITGDVAVGIFLVATVAWGFVGQRVYLDRRRAEPAGFGALLFGQPQTISVEYATAAVAVALAVVFAMTLFRKEIVAYCVDPLLSEVGGAAAAFVHYLLVALLAVTTIVGMQVVGTLLITALLVLPGATAQLVARRLTTATLASLAVGLTGALGGHAVSRAWPIIPVGPAIALAMVALFAAALMAKQGRFNHR